MGRVTHSGGSCSHISMLGWWSPALSRTRGVGHSHFPLLENHRESSGGVFFLENTARNVVPVEKQSRGVKGAPSLGAVSLREGQHHPETSTLVNGRSWWSSTAKKQEAAGSVPHFQGSCRSSGMLQEAQSPWVCSSPPPAPPFIPP